MTPWYRELNQRNRLLMVAAAATLEPRLTVTEFAVLTVLVNQGERMGVNRRSMLWQRGRDCSLLDREDRTAGEGVLPYTRQGIEKACKALIARGWIREDWSSTYERRDPGLTVLQLNILSVAPSWLKPNSLGSSPKDPKATPVASRSLRNKRSKRPVGSDGDRSKPATGTPESAADHAEAREPGPLTITPAMRAKMQTPTGAVKTVRVRSWRQEFKTAETRLWCQCLNVLGQRNEWYGEGVQRHLLGAATAFGISVLRSCGHEVRDKDAVRVEVQVATAEYCEHLITLKGNTRSKPSSAKAAKAVRAEFGKLAKKALRPKGGKRG